jgi:hypothetical protein
MPVPSYVHQLFNSEQCQAYIRDSRSGHGGRNAWRYRPHAADGESGASGQVASVAEAWDVRPRVHTAHTEAFESGPQTVEVLWNGCVGV